MLPLRNDADWLERTGAHYRGFKRFCEAAKTCKRPVIDALRASESQKYGLNFVDKLVGLSDISAAAAPMSDTNGSEATLTDSGAHSNEEV